MNLALELGNVHLRDQAGAFDGRNQYYLDSGCLGSEKVLISKENVEYDMEIRPAA